ncbi:hypothetical protein SLEP1_g45265 [Rubroshorea leprosula]|uniref:Uncharacterized protein n=1 Tax=Rubroshorea leprosula TaxID=152421 RepID=A0AAV5LIJ5_9ROSI|nr:hypothetical protein SLEP1_g45265 [Rubroshorea leprosula]
MEEDMVLTRVLPGSAITTGVLSVSNRYVVARMPTIEDGQNSALMVARDARQEGVIHLFNFRMRTDGGYAKQTLTGMKQFFDLHELKAGDRIMIHLVEEELRLFGIVIRHGVYSIDFEEGPVA